MEKTTPEVSQAQEKSTSPTQVRARKKRETDEGGMGHELKEEVTRTKGSKRNETEEVSNHYFGGLPENQHYTNHLEQGSEETGLQSKTVSG